MLRTAGASPASDGWAKRFYAATLFVDDLDAARHFYGDILEMLVLAEDEVSVAFQFPGLILNLVDVASAPELIEPLAAGGPGSPPRMMLTLEVPDLEAAMDRLRKRGVTFRRGPTDFPWGRTATFVDPCGHCWELTT